MDSLENIYYGIFPKIPYLREAVFYETDSLTVRCDLRYWNSEGILLERTLVLSEESFRMKKTEVDLILPMPWDWWYEQSGEKIRDENAAVLSDLQPGQWIEVLDRDESTYRGTVRDNSSGRINMKMGLFSTDLEYTQIRKCYVLTGREVPRILERNIRLGLGAAVGAGVWYSSPSMQTDRRYYTAFTFTVLGFFGSKYIFDKVVELIPERKELPLQEHRPDVPPGLRNKK